LAQTSGVGVKRCRRRKELDLDDSLSSEKRLQMAYLPKAPQVMSAPNVIPVLLIIFLVITPMLRPESLVTMAKA
jgi:hypothetical protein